MSGASSTPERLVNAAMRLFAEKGYGSTSVADISGNAEVLEKMKAVYGAK